MERVTTETDIRRPIQAVFDFVTTPANWPQWHPSSLGVSGATDHALAVGERVTEEYLVAGQRGRTEWLVTEREPPHRWVIATVTEETHTEGRVTYTLTATETGTHFIREFAYTAATAVPEPAATVIRRQVEAESAEALRRLTALLEAE
jgi:uncharacterized protein YndB with AHSA1/START domain